MQAILLLFHCESNAGYAINTLLPTFYKMAKNLVNDEAKIHISFTKLNGFTGDVETDKYKNLIEFDPASREKSQLSFIQKYIEDNQIDVVFGFDQPVTHPSYKYLRKGGVKKIISYWGAPISSPNKGIKLKLKQLSVRCAVHSPDHYIFESVAMAKTAYEGRGIQKRKVSVVQLGVDANKFTPTAGDTHYAHVTFKIPEGRKIIYFSGHMEERKGVAVLMKAVRHLYESHKRRDFHFLLLGNRHGEEAPFLDSLCDTKAIEHVTFAGYRSDVEKIIPGCYLGTIASTGWDSFTMSSIEIASCGLPLIVSNLQGLAETVEDEKTGFLFTPGNFAELSEHI